MNTFVVRTAMDLSEQYGVRGLIGEIAQRIQKYKIVNTPQGDKWMVKCDREWYLLDLS